MTKQKAKFELYSRLQDLGFTYEEAFSLRRIEMTLRRWAEQECNGEIERGDVGITAGKPFRVRNWGVGSFRKWRIADREAGALKRLQSIVNARNARKFPAGIPDADCHVDFLFAYHQTDPRGCMLYLVKTGDLNGQAIDSVYNRGVAVCC